MQREISLAADHLKAKQNKLSGKIAPWAQGSMNRWQVQLKYKVALDHVTANISPHSWLSGGLRVSLSLEITIKQFSTVKEILNKFVLFSWSPWCWSCELCKFYFLPFMIKMTNCRPLLVECLIPLFKVRKTVLWLTRLRYSCSAMKGSFEVIVMYVERATSTYTLDYLLLCAIWQFCKLGNLVQCF